MPPKKPDPQQQRKQYEEYRESEEWKKVDETYRELKSLPSISETSRDYDLNGKFQVLWDHLIDLANLMKVKPPFKKIEHEWIRSIFFGEKKKFDPKEQPYFLDGILCEFEATDADPQYNLRQALIKKIYNQISDRADSFSAENYAKTRAQVKKGLTQFFTLMKNYTKKSFKLIYEQKTMEIMKPFSDLLEINMRIVLHELKYITRQEQFVNDFKHRAIVERYCVCMEKVLHILSTYHNKPVKHVISPKFVFKKLAYENLTKVEECYLQPFRSAFNAMKEGLCALTTTGINFWKVPVEYNRKFVTDLNLLINWELITERFFGNPVLRAQINFMASTLDRIAKANQLSNKYLIKQDPNCIEIAIPRLIAFKTIQHMRNYKDLEAKLREQQMEQTRLFGETGNLSNTRVKEDQEASMQNSSIQATKTKESFKPSGTMDSKLLKTIGISLAPPPQIVDPVQQELEKRMGLYWIWENYCDEEFRRTNIEAAVEHLKHINRAVQQDIEDAIIREGMLPRRDRQNDELKMAAETLKNMKTIGNSLKNENLRRPPALWNLPEVVEEEHHFRPIADPKKCYLDGRIQWLDQKIVAVGNHLRKHNEKDWNDLVRRVIDFFSGKPDPNPFIGSSEPPQ